MHIEQQPSKQYAMMIHVHLSNTTVQLVRAAAKTANTQLHLLRRTNAFLNWCMRQQAAILTAAAPLRRS